MTIEPDAVELKYTVVADGQDATSGGWQLQSSSPVSADERGALLSAMPADLWPSSSVPAFPSAEQLAALPRRLRFVRIGENTGALVHSTPAGNDATGRPGNIFTHVQLHRALCDRLSQSQPVRPIQFWRSRDWLTPFGATDVQRAWIGDVAHVEPGDAVTRDTVLDFLYDEGTPRINRLAEVLDAVATAIDGGPRAVLVVDDVNDGALWLGVVSFLSAPAATARLTFSTYETSDSLRNQDGAPILSVLPADRHHATANAAQRDLAFLDLSEAHGRPVTDATWPSAQAGGSDWSELVVDLYNAGDVELERQIQAMDEISARYPAAAAHCPWWALAVAVADSEELRDSWPRAAVTILTRTEPSVRLDAQLMNAVRPVVAQAARHGVLTDDLADACRHDQLRPLVSRRRPFTVPTWWEKPQ